MGSYHTGDQLEVLLTAVNPAAKPARELYVGVLLPDGQTLVYFTAPNVVGGVASLTSLSALRPLTLMAPGEVLVFSASNPVVFLETPPGLPGGVYQWFAALVVPGGLADNSVDPGDVDAGALVDINIVP